MEKKILLALAFILAFSTITVMPAFALVHPPGNVTVFGDYSKDIDITTNNTKGNFTIACINTTQLNETTNSSTHVWFRDYINVSFCNCSAPSGGKETTGAIIHHINYTLPSTWVPNATTSVRLLNSTGNVIAYAANVTYSEDGPDYGRVLFNLTNISYSGTENAIAQPNGPKGNITLNNTSSATFSKLFLIEYILDTVDSHRSATVTGSGIDKTLNVTYPAPSNLTLENVTIYYNPSDWTSWDHIVSFDGNGTTLTEGTAGNTYTRTTSGLKINDNWDFGYDCNSSYIEVDYTLKESGKGGTGVGAIPPLVLPPAPGAVGAMFWVYAAIIAVVTTIALIGIWYFLRSKR